MTRHFLASLPISRECNGIPDLLVASSHFYGYARDGFRVPTFCAVQQCYEFDGVEWSPVAGPLSQHLYGAGAQMGEDHYMVVGGGLVLKL